MQIFLAFFNVFLKKSMFFGKKEYEGRWEAGGAGGGGSGIRDCVTTVCSALDMLC